MSSKRLSGEFSEDELALAFAERNPNYRWVQVWGKWFRWDGCVWKEDSTLHVFETVRQFLRKLSWADTRPTELGKDATVAAVE